jgi:hypothetical protein
MHFCPAATPNGTALPTSWWVTIGGSNPLESRSVMANVTKPTHKQDDAA